MSTLTNSPNTLLNKSSNYYVDLITKHSKDVLNNSVKLRSVDEITPFCITRRDCQKSFCACDLLDIDLRILNPRSCYTTLMICNKCYREKIIREYDIFESKIKGLREDFLDYYVAVKIYIMLNKIKEEIESKHCNCGKKECNFDNLTEEERRIINKKFRLMYDVFGTPISLENFK